MYSTAAPRPVHRRGGRLTLALIIAVVSLLSYFNTRSSNPITGETQYVAMSVDQEIALGLQASPEMAAQYGGESTDANAKARVQRVGQRLITQGDRSATPYHFDFHLLADRTTINAFALPAGQVFFTEGLYRRLDTDGQLAGVLGHEVGHVLERHSAQHSAKARLTQGLTGAAAIASYDPNNAGSRNTAMVAAMVGQIINFKYGRSQDSRSRSNLSTSDNC